MVFAALEACRPFQSSGLYHFTVHRLVSKRYDLAKKNQTDGVGRLIMIQLTTPSLIIE